MLNPSISGYVQKCIFLEKEACNKNFKFCCFDEKKSLRRRKMKKKIQSLVIAIVLVLCSVVPSFAYSQLERPVIEEVKTGKQSICINWQYIENAMEYDIYRSTSPDGKYYYQCTSDESWYRDYDIKKGTRYYYKVQAISWDEDSNSRLSKWRSARVKKTAVKHTNSTAARNTTRYPTSGISQSQTVYITNTGSKYHRYGCQYLWNSCIPISLNTARSYGYTACSRCW